MKNDDFVSEPDIERVLRENRRIVVDGLSANGSRPSHYVSAAMIDAGYDVVGVNPGHSTVLGRPVYRALTDVPAPLEIVCVFRASEALAGVVDECLALGSLPKVLWIQLGISDPAAEARAEGAGIAVVRQRCMMVERERFRAGRPPPGP